MSTDTFDAVREEAHIWAARHDGGLDKTSSAEFEHWLASDPLHREAYAEAEIFFTSFTMMPSLADARDTVPVTNDRYVELDVANTYFGYRAPRTGAIFAFAVAAIAVLGVIFFASSYGNFRQTSGPQIALYETPRAITKTVELPDGSRVTLSPQTSAQLDMSDGERRVVLVSGEAFFSVVSEPDRPFIVETQRGTVAVTGTQFEVVARGDDYSVSVGEGSVDVIATNPSSRTSLVAGEGIGFRDDGTLGEVETVYAAELASWRTGRLTYVRAPLWELVQDFNRFSETSLSIDERATDLVVTGTFNANDTEASLQSLQDALPISVNRQGGAITITAK